MAKYYIVSEKDLLEMMREIQEFRALRKDNDFKRNRTEDPNILIPYEEYTLPQELYDMFREKNDLGSFAQDIGAILRMYDFVRSKMK